jgi:hypothetical protein
MKLHNCPAPQFTANGFFTVTFRPTREGIHSAVAEGEDGMK